ncbi:MAG: ATP-dependent DNA helicase [Candidatus Omnitrophica bacterium]|nr:ATP-dependent DNA helicase [Candidatus Omnitrophota bacterium]MDD5487524.1 ATP-dependent DNA helicase [Candidatus Omnitrophota bacterium]
MNYSESVFSEKGSLSGSLKNYQLRPQQLEMASAIEEAISLGNNLIVEAGTGVGKSLAYLVPFTEWAVRENKKVVVSTYTKALQAQLYVKDLPFLRDTINDRLRYALCMGSENYVCARRVQGYDGSRFSRSRKKREEAERIIEWARHTRSGLVTDLDFQPTTSVWAEFCRVSGLCHQRACQFADSCSYRKARIEQENSHILVANHALVFSDDAASGRILPEYDALVFDEAHMLEDVATSHFSHSTGSVTAERLFKEIKNFIKEGKGILKDSFENVTELEEGLAMTEKYAERFFAHAAGMFTGRGSGPYSFSPEMFSVSELRDGLVDLADGLRRACDMIFYGRDSARISFLEEMPERASALSAECAGLATDMVFITGQEDIRHVYWAETREKKGVIEVFFRSAPIDVGEEMERAFFSRVAPVVLTSATLTSPDGHGKADFGFIRSRLGISDAAELVLNSPFDHENQVLLYVPRNISDPNDAAGKFREQVKDHVLEIYDILKGRMFVLFTSYEMLNQISGAIREEREDVKILKQGELPRYVLLDVFKQVRDSILMGTSTFWQGVDVPGRALECVVLTRLPFPVPNEPVALARMDRIRQEGQDPFYAYQVPRAVMMFKQGFGRLIRSESDRGVVVVLDPRILTRPYGSRFLNGIPGCRLVRDASEVRNFFSQ